jgi:nucleoside-diphosphate-sugar epimerase
MAIQRFPSLGMGWMERIADLAVMSIRRARHYARELHIWSSPGEGTIHRKRLKKLAWLQVARLAIDGLIVCAAVLLSETSRVFIYQTLSLPLEYTNLVLPGIRQDVVLSTSIIVFVSLLVFYWSGFYTFGRAYQGKYKLIIVSEAVAIAYLMVGTISFMLPEVISLPRSVLVASWLLSWLGLLHARVWASAWRAVVAPRPVPVDAADAAAPKSRNVLVIGGGGYIGSALVPRLLAEGCSVRILDVMMYGGASIQEALRHPKCELMQADFRHVDVLVKAMRGIDEVVHLGGLVGDPACAVDEELTIDINLAATRAVAEVAKGAGVRKFVFASTCSVYGASDEVLDERSALNPVSLYARTKIASERLLLKLTDDSFQPIIVRFGTIYGISGRTRFDLVVNLLTAKAVLDGEITVHGGDQWRPFLHVEDAARSVLMLLREPIEDTEAPFIFNVGCNRENYTIEQVAKLIRDQVPEASLSHGTFDGDRRNYRVDFTKIERAIGFTTHWTVEEGIRQVRELIQGGAVRNYRDPAYSNVTVLRESADAYLERPRPQWVQELIADSSRPPDLPNVVSL